MTDAPALKLYTAADLWALSHSADYDSARLELDEGELIVMSPAGGEHGATAMTIGAMIHAFVRQHRLGHVTAAETGYILGQSADGRDTVRAPDVGFVRADRLPVLPSGFIPLAPDLAVEVVSPTDTAQDVQHKIDQYLSYGTTQVWVVYPALRQVVVHTRAGSHTLTAADTLTAGDLLPGFALPLGEVFGG
ncbi:MAG: Uma2 family endonuclease [Chloroflexi bacterium]|nr:Uma2 family endonuclease [Chloroflexota bacterium]